MGEIINDTTQQNQPLPAPSETLEGEELSDLSNAEEREAEILADIDAAMEPFDLAYKYQMNPTEAIERSIKRHYEAGHGSIQDIARVYNVTVPTVLRAAGIDDMDTVETIGDLIDKEEAGPEATMNTGQKFRVPYTLD